MSIIDTLITDRTRADMLRVATLKRRILNDGLDSLASAEREEYFAGMKGAYSFTDLNRVGEAVAYITELLNEAGYSVTTSPKLDWDGYDKPVYPTVAQMTQYLKDIETLRGVLSFPSATPDAPTSARWLNWQRANDIEQILVDAEDALIKMRAAYIHSNTTFSGMGGLRR